MSHLQSAHPLNRHVTTFTYCTFLTPKGVERYLTPSLLVHARDKIATKTQVTYGEGKFKNSFSVMLHVASPREDAAPRKISTKVFHNLRLQMTGAHCLEMAQHVVNVIKTWLSEFTEMPLEEVTEKRKVCVSLYKYMLPGEINVTRVQDVLNEAGILFVYDATNYAGIRAKFPIADGKLASVMIFRKGKIIIIIPEQQCLDAALHNIREKLDSVLVGQWSRIATQAPARDAAATRAKAPKRRRDADAPRPKRPGRQAAESELP